MSSRNIHRSLLSAALAAAIGLPGAVAWASTPQGPQTILSAPRSLGEAHDSAVAFSLSGYDPARLVVYADRFLSGTNVVDNVNRFSGSPTSLLLGSDSSCTPQAPSVGISEASYGRHTVVWTCVDDANHRSLRMRSVNNFVNLQSGPWKIGATSSLNQDNPAVAMYGNYGEGMVAWSGEVEEGHHTIFVQSLYDGATISSPRPLEYIPTSVAPLRPAMATDSSGFVAVVWSTEAPESPSQNRVQLDVFDGFYPYQTSVLDQDPAAVYGPAAIASSSTRHRVAAWTRDGGVFAQRLDRYYQPVGPQITVAPIDGTVRSAVKVTMESRDGFWVGWENSDQDGDAVFVRQFRSGGAAVDTATRVDDVDDPNLQNGGGISEVIGYGQQLGGLSSTAVGYVTADWDQPASDRNVIAQRTMVGLNDDDYFPTVTYLDNNGAGYPWVTLRFAHTATSGNDTPIYGTTLTVTLPPGLSLQPNLGCSGYGTTTLTCPVYVSQSIILELRPRPPSGSNIPITVKANLGIVDGIPENDTLTTVVHVN